MGLVNVGFSSKEPLLVYCLVKSPTIVLKIPKEPIEPPIILPPVPTPVPEPVPDTTAPEAPAYVDDGLRHNSLTTSPLIEWPASTSSDVDHYLVSIGTSPGGQDILQDAVATGLTFTASALSLESGTVYYAWVVAQDQAGNNSSPTLGDGWENLSCPTGYIKIVGNKTSGLGGSVYASGTQTRIDGSLRAVADFCVMKYEAKIVGDPNNPMREYISTLSLESRPDGLPMTKIERAEAIGACEDIGIDHALINNAQWQTIARDIENQPANWEEGLESTPSNAINRGHSDGGGALEASTDDSLGCMGIGGGLADDCAGAWDLNKRTHILSNGEAIWDLAGDVRE
jgi:hypothetical protein